MISHTTYKTFTWIVFIALLVPTLVQEGMFLDGVVYAAISKNLAAGYGQYCNPHYTKTLYPNFSEHPPFVFIIESLFFKLFGTSFYAERIFTFTTALLTAYSIMMCWRELANDSYSKENDWLPVLLWLMVPIVSWSYRNNLLENTMSVFTTFSVFLIVKALKSNSIYLIPLSGVLIICAFLSKGFVGLFPIITPLIFGVLFKQNKKSIIYFFLLILSVSIFSFIAIRVFPEMTDNIVRYFNHQFLPSIKGQREITTHSRFKMIIELFLDLSVIFTLLAFLLFLRIKNTKIKTFTFNKNFLFFLFIGISASVPLIISLKQRKFYLVPSIPFYAMAFASLLNPLVMEASDKISSTVFKKINKVLYAILVFLIIFSILKFGTYSRDMEKIKDVSMISQYLNEGTIITSSKEICSDWGLIAYFSRIGYISIDCNNEHDYFLMKNGDEFPTNYRKIVMKGMCYTLLEREAKTSP